MQEGLGQGHRGYKDFCQDGVAVLSGACHPSGPKLWTSSPRQTGVGCAPGAVPVVTSLFGSSFWRNVVLKGDGKLQPVQPCSCRAAVVVNSSSAVTKKIASRAMTLAWGGSTLLQPSSTDPGRLLPMRDIVVIDNGQRVRILTHNIIVTLDRAHIWS